MRLHLTHHAGHTFHHICEVHRGLGFLDAVLFRMLHLVKQARGFDQGLAGHAAVVQAVTTHLVAFNQSHLGFDGCCNVGTHQTRCARTDHHQVTVKRGWFLIGPRGVDLALFDGVDDFLGDQRKHPQQHERAEQGGRQNSPQRIDACQLCTRVHIDHGTRQHAELAGHVKHTGLHAREAHQEVDHKKRHQRYQAQGKEVEGALFLHPFVDVCQPRAEARLHGVTQHITRGQKGQCGSQAGRKGHEQGAGCKPKDGPGSERHDDCARQGQRRDEYVNTEKETSHFPWMGLVRTRQLCLP